MNERGGAAQFLKGTAFLSLSVFVCKFLGIFYNVPLQHIIHDAGVGLYNKAYPIYTIFLTIATAGLPLAVSKFVAEFNARGDYQTSERLFRLTTFLMTLSGLVFAAILYFGAPLYVDWFLAGDREMIPIVQALVPALLIFPAMATIRGYFQGWQAMEPTGNSQMAEQFVRVATVLIAAVYMTRAGDPIPEIVVVATFGAFTGGLAGLLVLMLYLSARRKRVRQIMHRSSRRSVDMKGLLRRVVAYSIPISLAALVVPLFNQVDASTVETTLRAAGFSTLQTNTLFGILGGRAWKIIAIPATFSSTIALTVIPLISEAHALRNVVAVRQRAILAIRLTVFIAVPSALGLAILAGPADTLLFSNPDGAGTIAILSISTIFSTLESVTSGILQGLGKTYRPVWNLGIGVIIKIILNLALVPAFGIAGAASATVLSYVLASALNMRALRHEIHGFRLPAKRLWTIPILASGVMCGIIYGIEHILFRPFAADAFVHHFAVNVLFLTFCVLIGGAVYVWCLVTTGAMPYEELERVPKVGRLFRMLKKATART